MGFCGMLVGMGRCPHDDDDDDDTSPRCIEITKDGATTLSIIIGVIPPSLVSMQAIIVTRFGRVCLIN